MKKKLKRNTSEKMIAGVCSGLADYFGFDKTWIRLIWAILAVSSFSLFAVIYIIFWIVVPEDDNIIDI